MLFLSLRMQNFKNGWITWIRTAWPASSSRSATELNFWHSYGWDAIWLQMTSSPRNLSHIQENWVCVLPTNVISRLFLLMNRSHKSLTWYVSNVFESGPRHSTQEEQAVMPDWRSGRVRAPGTSLQGTFLDQKFPSLCIKTGFQGVCTQLILCMFKLHS